MNTPTGHNEFQNIARHVAKFRENRFGDVEKSMAAVARARVRRL